MAGLSLRYEECIALRAAVERVPPEDRSRALASALRTLVAVITSIERAREKLDPEDDPPTSVDGPAS